MNKGNSNIARLWNKSPVSLILIGIWIVVSLLATFLANEGGVPAPIPYSSTTIDLSNAGAVGPFESQTVESMYYRHWLGTDELGRDVLAQLIYGSRTALLVGLFSMLISSLIGIGLGMTAGFLGDHSIKLNQTNSLLIFTVSILFFAYLCFVLPWSVVDSWQVLMLTFLFLISIWVIIKVKSPSTASKKSVPVDLMIGRLIEAMDSLPILFIIISLSAIIRPSIYSVILIIGISNWAQIARYARSETLKIKQASYIESARAIGLNRSAMLWRHILPNALPTLGVALAFNIVAAILIEATLSFLGVGIGVEEASWGSMLSEARRSPFAWWLAVFPGLAIFAVVYASNQIAEALSD